MAKKELKQSETRDILRSQINLNPINPKRHTEEAVKLQRRNLQRVGYLGGIVWNEVSGNIIDGHRRIYAMDLYYSYDGTPETDYTVKVEVVNLDEKTEKEQLTYMAVGNTKADIDLIAQYITEIDYKDVGLSNSEINDILAMTSTDVADVAKTLDLGFFTEPEEKQIEDHTDESEKSQEEKTEHMKSVKEQVRQNAIERQLDEQAYITLSFSSFQAKSDFCQMIDVDPMSNYAKGEEVMRMIE